jgi:hypothetical protein
MRHSQQYTTVVKETRPSQAATQQDAVSTQQIKARPLQQLPHGSHRTQAHSIQGVAIAEESSKHPPQIRAAAQKGNGTVPQEGRTKKSQVCHS